MPDQKLPATGAAVNGHTRPKILELESIRGLAAMLVFFSHIPAWNLTFFSPSVIRNGGLMVPLFFVLSGFVICENYGGERLHSLRELARFQLLRFGRLYPVHLLVMAIFLCLEVAKVLLIHDPISPAFQTITWSVVLENLLLVQGLGLFLDAFSINGPSWSISTEFYTYLLFAGICLVFGSRKAYGYGLVVVLSVAFMLFEPQNFVRYYRMMSCISGFFIGCFVSLACREMLIRQYRFPSSAINAVMLVIFLFMAFDNSRSSLSDIGIMLLSALLIVVVVFGENGVIKRALRSAPLEHIGRWSYSIYMVHFAVIYVVDTMLRRALGFPTVKVEEMVCAQLTLTEAAIMIALLTVGVVVVSGLIYRFIEAPFRDKFRVMSGGHGRIVQV